VRIGASGLQYVLYHSQYYKYAPCAVSAMYDHGEPLYPAAKPPHQGCRCTSQTSIHTNATEATLTTIGLAWFNFIALPNTGISPPLAVVQYILSTSTPVLLVPVSVPSKMEKSLPRLYFSSPQPASKPKKEQVTQTLPSELLLSPES
jgi:hypothetical protein